MCKVFNVALILKNLDTPGLVSEAGTSVGKAVVDATQPQVQEVFGRP